MKRHTNLYRRIGIVTFFTIVFATVFLIFSRQTAMSKTFEINYQLANASEVWIVWGVDGWKPLPQAARPPGTIIQDGMMQTPLTRTSNGFGINVTVPLNTWLNYGFLVTEFDGQSVRIWDEPTEDGLSQRWPRRHTVTYVSPLTIKQYGEDWLLWQEIRYQQPDAGEVIIVWGVNNWQQLPVAQRPQTTVVRNGVMITPMLWQDDSFVTTVPIPLTGVVNYGFLVERRRSGEIVSLWEADENGDFTITAASSKQILHRSALAMQDVSPTARPLTPGWGIVMLLGIVALLTLANAWRVSDSKSLTYKQHVERLLAMGTALLVFLVTIRADMLDFSWISWPVSWVLLPYTIAAGYHDMLYAVGLTAVFVMLMWFMGHRRGWQRGITAVYTFLALFSLVMALFNVQAIYLMGRPATYQLLYYADFLQSTDGQTAVSSNLSPTIIALIVAMCVAWYGVSLNLVHGWHWIQSWKRPWAQVLTILPVLIYLPIAQITLNRTHWDDLWLVNPITTFAQSIIEINDQTALFTADVPTSYSSALQPPSAPEPLTQTDVAQIENVILVVLESVGAGYLDIYGGPYAVTPNLTELRQHGILFENAYAHVPASNKSLISILSSTYPWISYQALTEEHPEVPLQTLSSVLKAQDYRTAFLSTGDWRYQRGDEFLAQRQFDLLHDLTSLPCDSERLEGGTADELYFDGMADSCLVDVLTPWVMAEPERPFFAMLWTIDTHYPYFVVEEEINYGVDDPSLNRYLNAIRHSDDQIGRLVEMLEAQGLLDSTLIVVTGDHGEAFGQHAQFGHALSVYEENIHVPLLFSHPTLFAGETDEALTGHVDIAPSVMHLLGLPSPSKWQGHSLFAADRSPVAFSFTPWADALFTVRQGDLKLIYNANIGESKLYDLQADPLELTNVAEQFPEVVAEGQTWLAAWIQMHTTMMDGLLTPEP